MDYLLISSVYALLETFFLISIRVLGFFVIVPVFGGQSTPNMAKITISMATAFIMLTAQGVTLFTPENPSVLTFFAAGIKELAVGLVMGFTIYFMISIFYYVGQLVDFQIGFSMVSVFDPINQLQIPISGNLFYLTVSLLLILSGAHYNYFRALFYSYQVIPIGTAVFTEGSLGRIGVGIFGTFLELGFKMALPVVGTMLVLEVALGILNKATPQMHIFSIGMSMKILVGLGIIFIMLPIFSTVSETLYSEINRTLYTMIRGLMPE